MTNLEFLSHLCVDKRRYMQMKRFSRKSFYIPETDMVIKLFFKATSQVLFILS